MTIEENGCKPLVVVSRGADGISSLARAMTWAEWGISDFEGQQDSPKRARRGSRRVSVHKIEGGEAA